MIQVDDWYIVFNATLNHISVRDRPFNLKGGGYVFLFGSEIFFGQYKSYNIYFFLSRKAPNFNPEYIIRLYDKNSESDYFFYTDLSQVTDKLIT